MINVENSRILPLSLPLGISFNEEDASYTYWFKQFDSEDAEWQEIGNGQDLIEWLESYHMVEA